MSVRAVQVQLVGVVARACGHLFFLFEQPFGTGGSNYTPWGRTIWPLRDEPFLRSATLTQYILGKAKLIFSCEVS